MIGKCERCAHDYMIIRNLYTMRMPAEHAKWPSGGGKSLLYHLQVAIEGEDRENECVHPNICLGCVTLILRDMAQQAFAEYAHDPGAGFGATTL